MQNSHLQSALMEVQHDEVHNPSHYLVSLAAVIATAEGQEGQLLWQLHNSSSCAELPSQAVQLRAMTWEKWPPWVEKSDNLGDRGT